jgi:hypothetical protein
MTSNSSIAPPSMISLPPLYLLMPVFLISTNGSAPSLWDQMRKKTEFIIFSSKCHAQHSQSLSIHLDGHPIKTSWVIRDLGVLLGEHLTLENHVCKVRQLTFMSMRIISKVRRFLSKTHAELLIDALAFSRINFCISLFAGAPKSLLKRLQSILHYGVRIIEKMKKFNDVAQNPNHKRSGFYCTNFRR